MSENPGDRAFAGLEKYRDLLIVLFLILCNLIVYWQVQYAELIDYDDISYIIRNRHVRSGLSWDSFIWAMTDIHTGYWHPLTWLSHMLDYELFRDGAGGHHWMSLIFHIANVVMLYIFLRRATADVWRSAFVAALFAVHPVNVESVAWVAERKNLVSTFFWIMAMWAYVIYAERPSWYRYGLVFLAFVSGLAAKPMLVTLPCVLLLLDFWPLRRFDTWKTFPRLLLEKIPLFLLSAIVSVFTLLATRHEGAVISFTSLPMKDRVYHAAISYERYLGKLFWPDDLAVFYPYIKDYNLWHVAGAFLILASISLFAGLLFRRRYLLTGWLWYLGTLVPVVGFIQAGDQAMADRYMYIPAIGVFIMVTWGLSDILEKRPAQKFIFATVAGVVIFSLSICAFHQAGFWKNSMTLFGHTLQVTRQNALAHNNLGVALMNQGRMQEAERHFMQAIEIKRDYAAPHDNMGLILAEKGKLHEAVMQYREAIRIRPNDERTYSNIGIAFARMGRLGEAGRWFGEAIRINPDNADGYNNMGAALARAGKVKAAIPYFERTLQLDKDHAMAHDNMGLALAHAGRFDEAVDHFRTALKINPDFKAATHHLNAVLGQRKVNKY
jgi:protein O-mannosyl-transferase